MLTPRAAPRVVLADDDVLLREGLQAARVIREELPGTAIVVLSAHVEVNEAMDLLATAERLGTC